MINLHKKWDVSYAYLEPFFFSSSLLVSLKKLETVIIANNFGVLVTVFAAVCYFACLLFSVFFFLLLLCCRYLLHLGTFCICSSIRRWNCLVWVCLCCLYFRFVERDVCLFRLNFVSFTPHLFYVYILRIEDRENFKTFMIATFNTFFLIKIESIFYDINFTELLIGTYSINVNMS